MRQGRGWRLSKDLVLPSAVDSSNNGRAEEESRWQTSLWGGFRALPASERKRPVPPNPPAHHQLRAEGAGWTDSVLFRTVLLTIQPKLAKK